MSPLVSRDDRCATGRSLLRDQEAFLITEGSPCSATRTICREREDDRDRGRMSGSGRCLRAAGGLWCCSGDIKVPPLCGRSWRAAGGGHGADRHYYDIPGILRAADGVANWEGRA